jgi:hypothetical protein
VLQRKDISAKDHATMQEFMGANAQESEGAR